MSAQKAEAERLDAIDDETCRAFQAAIELIGKRWSAAILLAVARGAERFGEIRHCVGGITEPVLAQRLRELEKVHLIDRTVIPTMPVQITYTVTERGRELLGGVIPLSRWTQKWLDHDTGP